MNTWSSQLLSRKVRETSSTKHCGVFYIRVRSKINTERFQWTAPTAFVFNWCSDSYWLYFHTHSSPLFPFLLFQALSFFLCVAWCALSRSNFHYLQPVQPLVLSGGTGWGGEGRGLYPLLFHINPTPPPFLLSFCDRYCRFSSALCVMFRAACLLAIPRHCTEFKNVQNTFFFLKIRIQRQRLKSWDFIVWSARENCCDW